MLCILHMKLPVSLTDTFCASQTHLKLFSKSLKQQCMGSSFSHTFRTRVMNVALKKAVKLKLAKEQVMVMWLGLREGAKPRHRACSHCREQQLPWAAPRNGKQLERSREGAWRWGEMKMRYIVRDSESIWILSFFNHPSNFDRIPAA